MDAKEAAAQLDGSQYGREGSRELFAAMKAAGLVAVFGASDDLVEFRGAIDDEVGAYGGTTIPVTSKGLLVNECSDENCPHFANLTAGALTIDAKWDDGGYSWRFETGIPCERFVVKEDDEDYCEGIVFELVAA